MPASIWNPGGTLIPQVDPNQQRIVESFQAIAGQTIFILTAFTYLPGAEAIEVYVNGVKQLGTDVAELSATSFSLAPCDAGDAVEVIGNTAAINTEAAAVAAAASALAASNSAAAAAASAASITVPVPVVGGGIGLVSSGASGMVPVSTGLDTYVSTDPATLPIVKDTVTAAPVKSVLAVADKLALLDSVTGEINSTTLTNLQTLLAALFVTKNNIDGQLYGFRNRLINGNFCIDQRHVGIVGYSATAAAIITVDRWLAWSSVEVFVNQEATTPAVGYQLSTDTAAPGTVVYLAQRMEAANTVDLTGTTCTLSLSASFGIVAEQYRTVTYYVYRANTLNTFGTVATPTKSLITSGTMLFASGAAFTRKEVQLAITTADNGLEVVFSYVSSGGSAKFQNVQFEKSSVATIFENRPRALELQLCYPYMYAVSPAQSGVHPVAGNVSGQCYSTTAANPRFAVPIRLRGSPTSSVSPVLRCNLYDGAATIAVTALTMATVTVEGGAFTATVAAGLTVGRTVTLMWAATAQPGTDYIALMAEIP